LDDRRTIIHNVKNFLRLSKGRGFREVIYKGSKGPYDLGAVDSKGLCLDITYSEQNLKTLRKFLLKFDSDIVKNFMNSVFNGLNEVTSELFMIIKEEMKANSNLSPTMERRIRFYFDLIIDLCRILEVVSKWAPELFLDKNTIHINRTMEFMFFVLRSIFRIDFRDKL
jgi:hypothetical protein